MMKDLLPTLIIILITFINQYIITIINSALFLHLISFGAKKHSKDTKTYLFFLRFFFQRILGFLNKCQHFHSRSLFPSITFFSLKPPIFTFLALSFPLLRSPLPLSHPFSHSLSLHLSPFSPTPMQLHTRVLDDFLATLYGPLPKSWESLKSCPIKMVDLISICYG